jgi:triacylglycerol esterase/lipase EstA (alpha/beta hydrolase family)
MDKIHRSNPIKARQVRQPVVFTFNILLNHYLAFRTQQYNQV